MKIGWQYLSILTSMLLMLGCSSSSQNASASLDEVHTKNSLLEHFDEVDQGRVLIVAHRGCWSAAPENSLKSIQNCLKLGVEAVEIDVRLTADGELVVFHDKTLDRMTNGKGKIAETNLDNIRKLTLFERDGASTDLIGYPIMTSQRVPTLRELLDVSKDRVLINLEIKSSSRWSHKDTFDASVKIVKESGLEDYVFWKIPAPSRGGSDGDVEADEVLRSFDTDGLTRLTPILWKGEKSFEDQLEDFSKHDLKAFEIVSKKLDYWPLGDDGRIIGADKFRYMGVAVLPKWSAGLSDEVSLVDPDAGWGKLIDLGADIIMTDRPEQLIDYLDKRGLR